MRIPVSAAKEISKKYKLSGVIIIGIDDTHTQLATYGKDKRLCKSYGSVGDQLAKLVADGTVKPKE